MINGAHVIVYSRDPEADRAFFRDTLAYPHVDAGHGWLIFRLPPAELALHPTDEGQAHELFLMCDDVKATMAELAAKGVEFTIPVTEEPWGLRTALRLPAAANSASTNRATRSQSEAPAGHRGEDPSGGRKETAMSVQITTIMLGVEDVARSKQFYAEGLGCAVEQDHGGFVLLNLGEGSSRLALYPRNAAAADAGVPPEGSGFPGVSFHHIVSAKETVDEVIGKAVAAGARVVKEAAAAPWGGYSGYFSDPDGYLWKVASNS